MLDLVSSDDLFNFTTAIERGTDPLLIAIHDYPDPDAIASALAMQTLSSSFGIETVIVYGGRVGRPENITMVNLLNIELTNMRDISDFSKYRGAVFIDSHPKAKNHSLPSSVPVLAVIDHHRASDITSPNPDEDEFSPDSHSMAYHDIRTDVGASSTLALSYLHRAGIVPNTRLATALFLGVKTDTDSLLREASPYDMDAYVHLLPLSDLSIIAKVSRPPLTNAYFSLLHHALEHTYIYGSCSLANCDDLTSPDMLSVVSDMMIQSDSVYYSLAYGRYQGRIYLSLRTKPPQANAAVVLLHTVSGIGKSGGHGLSAGGFLSPVIDFSASELDLTNRFLAATGNTNSLKTPLF